MLRQSLVSKKVVSLASRRYKSELPRFISKHYEFDYENYPKIKPELYQLRDPYKKYDDQQLRRNDNEPLHPDHDLLDMWSPDYYNVVDDATAFKWFVSLFATIGGFVALIYYTDIYPERPNYPRSYPHDGLAKDLGAKDDSDAHLYRTRIDRTA